MMAISKGENFARKFCAAEASIGRWSRPGRMLADLLVEIDELRRTLATMREAAAVPEAPVPPPPAPVEKEEKSWALC
jgi:hypothetical protein